MTTHRSARRRLALALAATTTAAALLAGCGGGDDDQASDRPSGTSSAAPSASASQEAHNAQDVLFAQGMIPHHRQAVAMADLAPDRARSAAVKALAVQIRKAQDPEITTMSGWLTGWGEQVPEGAMGGSDPVDHSGHDMNGMMSDADMEKLKGLRSAEFDTEFLRMMVEHHRGAVAMARTEQAKGAHGPSKRMAGAIVKGQTAEIATMNGILEAE